MNCCYLYLKHNEVSDKYDLVKAEIHRLLPSAFRQADDPDMDEVIKNIIEICETEGAG